jgi:hypothetical protein
MAGKIVAVEAELDVLEDVKKFAVEHGIGYEIADRNYRGLEVVGVMSRLWGAGLSFCFVMAMA